MGLPCLVFFHNGSVIVGEPNKKIALMAHITSLKKPTKYFKSMYLFWPQEFSNFSCSRYSNDTD